MAALHTLKDPQLEETVELGDHVEGMLAAWEAATKEDKGDMLQFMLESV